jgi:hypothetical protein
MVLVYICVMVYTVCGTYILCKMRLRRLPLGHLLRLAHCVQGLRTRCVCVVCVVCVLCVLCVVCVVFEQFVRCVVSKTRVVYKQNKMYYSNKGRLSE